MHNLRSTTLRRRAPVLALFALAFVLWTTASAAACKDGYYRFTNSMTNATNAVSEWSARSNDYKGAQPYGLSFFMDLSKSEYDTMNIARAAALQSTSYVYKIPCADLVSPLNYTAAATQSTDWTQAGGAKHGVISAKGASGGSGFNKTKVNKVKANKYLLSKAVYVTKH